MADQQPAIGAMDENGSLRKVDVDMIMCVNLPSNMDVPVDVERRIPPGRRLSMASTERNTGMG